MMGDRQQICGSYGYRENSELQGNFYITNHIKSFNCIESLMNCAIDLSNPWAQQYGLLMVRP
jgi:hypothetical protein